MKKLLKMRNWIIHKLGGITFDDVSRDVGVIKDYWKHECVHTSLYVDQSMCTDEYVKSIEREIARKIADIMLEAGHISFTNRRSSHGDVEIYGQAHMLMVKEPTSAHMPSRLKFDEPAT